MEKEFKALPGSDVRKVAIAAKIWEHTTMSMSWISENLGMKDNVSYFSHNWVGLDRGATRKPPKYED
jgi:hypothetical protein